MLERIRNSFADPANAQRYRLAALLIGTAFFAVNGIGNALEPPEPDSVYKQEGAVGILLVLGQTLPLAIAFRYPMIALVVIIVAFAAHTGLNHELIWVVQFTAALSFLLAITRGGGRQSLLALLVVSLGIVVSFGVFGDADRLGNVIIQMLLFVGIWIMGNLFRTRRIRLESTEQVVTRLEAEQDRLAREAVQDERARIARDLHDIIGHTLNIIVVQAGAARAVFKSRPDQALDSLSAIETTARQSLSDMERMLGILRPPEAEALPYGPQPGLGQVEILAEQFSEAGLPVKVSVAGEPHKLPTSLDLSAYRIVQEALTNVLKHAGPARARVAVSFLADKLELDIVDDGQGSSGDGHGARGGRGLIGMRERVSLFGGELDVGPLEEGGFRVHATLPIEESR